MSTALLQGTPANAIRRRGETSRLWRFASNVAAVSLLLLAVTLEAQTMEPIAMSAGSAVQEMAGMATAQGTGVKLIEPAFPATGIGTGTGPLAPLPGSGKSRKASLAASELSLRGNPAQTSLAAYLDRVRVDTTGVKPTTGAIWTDNGRLARFSTDDRAMRPHDLISVVVQESLAAETDGTVKNSRASSASSQVSALFGLLHAGNALQNLLNQSSALGLTAGGQSASNSSLSTTLGGQVIEVLPNGMLVIEAARQVEFSQQTQTIVLRGLVRPEDISQQNQVLSTAISSLELEVRGKGIVNDATYRQNPLVRLIEKVLVF